MNKAERLTALEIRLTRLEGHMLPDRVALLEDVLQAVIDDAAEETECADLANTADPYDTKLYDEMFHAMRPGDKLIVAIPLDYKAVIAKMAAELEEAGQYYIGPAHWQHEAEAALAVLKWADRDFLEAEHAAQNHHAPSVPRSPTVGDDYHFFLRVNGCNDHPCLWRAFLAGRLTG